MTKRALCLVLLAACSSTYNGDDGDDSCYGCGGQEPAPEAHDDHVMLAEDETLPQATLLANDVNVQHVKVVGMPQHGTIDSYGHYEPFPGYFGVDQFTYEGTYSSYSTVASRATVYLLINSDGIPYETSRHLADTAVTALATGDIDGDGKIDIVTCASSSHQMTIFLNKTTTTGSFSVEPHTFEGGTTPAKIVVADIDGDGKQDIVTAAADGVTLFRNITTGPLAFAAPVILPTNDQVTSIVVADLNGDGVKDLAATDGSYASYGALYTWLNTSTAGTLSFGVRSAFAAPKWPAELQAVDADGTGGIDLALLGQYSDNEKLSLYVNATSAGSTTVAFQTRIDRDTGPGPRHLFRADLDGDGKAELGVLHNSGDLWIYANAGGTTPSYEAARVLDLGDVGLVAPISLNGDAKMDLFGIATGDAALQLMTSTSQPQMFEFDTKDGIPGDAETHKRVTFGSLSGFAYADLDGDGVPELVVGTGSYPIGTLSVLYGP